MAGRYLGLRSLGITVALALGLAACASGSGSSVAADESMGMASVHADESVQMDEVHFGEPADPADADRVIEITGHDDFSWDPTSVEIAVGETVTLRVTNAGAITHDFLLGDEHMQEGHEQDMRSGMGHMGDQPNAFVLDPGQTRETTWTFAAVGELLYGCHQPGHYAAGMVGTITVK